MAKVSIIGYGWVGKAMHKLFPDADVYSPSLEKQGKCATKEEINKNDVAFICVPTPPIGENKLDTSLVEECIKWCQCRLIVVRSTVNPGDCGRWMETYHKQIVFQPEYLGETPQHPLLDAKFIIIGGLEQHRRQLIELYQNVYNANITIRQMGLYEAEIVKLTENRAIAFKVAECQELYDVCQLAEVDYYAIRDAVYGDDPRFNLWWTFVYPDKRGFNSKCIPKDVYAWCAWAESLGYKPDITRAILKKNKTWINSQ